MSYILDALRRAEEERKLGQAPSLPTAPSAPAAPRRVGWWLVALAVLVNAAVLVWFSAPRWPTSPSPEATLPPAATAAAATVTAPTVVVAAQPLPVAPPQSLPELPGAGRQELPPLNVDIHVFSDQPERRFVLINGKRYQQGDWLPEGPLLETITADGVVLSYQNQRFTLSVQRP